MSKRSEPPVAAKIDDLTDSIRNAETGQSHATTLFRADSDDLKKAQKADGWQFDWLAEHQKKDRKTFKLTLVEDSETIQGLVSLTERPDHVYLNLIENAPHNLGPKKQFVGVAGNLFAFACLHSFENGHEGYVAFLSKTGLIKHYRDSLGAKSMGNQGMFLDTEAAKKLIDKYFKS